MKHYSKKSNAKHAIEKIYPGLFAAAWADRLVTFAGDAGFDQPVVCDMAAIKRLHQSRIKEQEND